MLNRSEMIRRLIRRGLNSSFKIQHTNDRRQK